MKFDMIVSGVGGQGILSISFVVDNAAMEENLHFKQSEVHGMAQRGGAVFSHLRVSDETIYSDLVPFGAASIIMSMEPLEALRYQDYLAQDGAVVTSTAPFVNIPNYPELEGVIGKVQAIKNHTLVNSADLARAAGSAFAQNMVMLGASSHLIPMENKTLEKYISVLFKNKGEKIVNINIDAFRFGAMAGSFYRNLLAAGLELKDAATVAIKMAPAEYSDDEVKGWVQLCNKAGKENLINWMNERKDLLNGKANTIKALDALELSAATSESLENAVV